MRFHLGSLLCKLKILWYYISLCCIYIFLGVTRYLKEQFQLSQVPQLKNNKQPVLPGSAGATFQFSLRYCANIFPIVAFVTLLWLESRRQLGIAVVIFLGEFRHRLQDSAGNLWYFIALLNMVEIADANKELNALDSTIFIVWNKHEQNNFTCHSYIVSLGPHMAPLPSPYSSREC